jgi:hypothetical protein
VAYNSTTPDGKILQALMDRMKTLVTTLPIQWPGEALDAMPEDRKFIEIIHLPNETSRLLIKGSLPHRYYGIFQPTLHWPIKKGELEMYEQAGLIAAHFPADQKMYYNGVRVRSLKRPTVETAVIEDSDNLVAVTVEYESYI